MIQSPRGMSIMEAYELFRKDKLFVNRRYQRKLVWTMQEKQSLVESIIKKYPIPLILLAENSQGDFEIIDGMQRLNAIFGFIENQFYIDLNSKQLYFNVADYTFAQTVSSKGVFCKIEGQDFISQEVVSAFLSYQFPVTIYEADDDDEINETFRRINAGGKHLSPQEVRQAGNTSKFAGIVREIASKIRGDASKNILLLSQMPEISIESKSNSVGNGIIAESTIWCSQGIIRISDLRDSEDEQIIADIMLSILIGTPFPASKDEFDNYYATGKTDKSTFVETRLNQYGVDNVKKDIQIVFSEIINLCNTLESGIKLKHILNPKAGSNSVKEAFYTLFMTYYDLIIISGKIPFDIDGIIKAITNLHSRFKKVNNYITTANRLNNINLTKGLIQDYFKDSQNTFRNPATYIIDFQAYLMKSKVESATYDFKQGLYSLNPDSRKRKFSDETFENKILKNIAALANLGKNKKGLLFLGVTDKEEDTVQVEKIYGLSNLPRYYGFGVVGLEREAQFKGVSLDQYIQFITEKISKSELPDDLKARVTKAITPITYSGQTVLMIEVVCGDSPVYYKDRLYSREGANCIEITGAKVASIFNLFK
ncbi:hypothetical protein N494_03975 [Clostridium botulinum A2B7 92]|uniref:GmrSD restriction endonuclease domain-containing protein n=1 Tax=Clostridium botulinum TaxID=1491 RepID=UPI0007DFA13A|nr:DUF262 domain-containing protein [Clostridium botulinum]KEJ00168.1 hypothetical protein N494_03975 [Clostridium botulinum A2B7 92]